MLYFAISSINLLMLRLYLILSPIKLVTICGLRWKDTSQSKTNQVFVILTLLNFSEQILLEQVAPTFDWSSLSYSASFNVTQSLQYENPPDTFERISWSMVSQPHSRSHSRGGHSGNRVREQRPHCPYYNKVGCT